MSLHIAKEMAGQDLVLCCEDDDKMSTPEFKKFPALQCYLEEYVKGDQNQLWVWDDWTYYLKNVATGMYLTVFHGTLMMGHYDDGKIDWNTVDKAYPFSPQWFEFCPLEHVLETEINEEPVYAAVQPNIKLRNDI